MHKLLDNRTPVRVLSKCVAESFQTRLREWRGKRRQKEAASDLDVSLRTYQAWEEGLTTPSQLALAELERRMYVTPDPYAK